TEEILDKVREKVLPAIDVEIDGWKHSYSPQENPSDYFAPLKSALGTFAKALAHDTGAVRSIEKGIALIDEAIAGLDSQGSEDPDYGVYYPAGGSGPSIPDSRSIFDDVDS